MWYLTLQRWTVDPREATADLLDQHLDWMHTQTLRGTVLLAGPSADMELAIVIFRAEDRAEAERLCHTEPFVAAGYRTVEMIDWDVHQIFGINTSPPREPATA